MSFVLIQNGALFQYPYEMPYNNEIMCMQIYILVEF